MKKAIGGIFAVLIAVLGFVFNAAAAPAVERSVTPMNFTGINTELTESENGIFIVRDTDASTKYDYTSAFTGAVNSGTTELLGFSAVKYIEGRWLTSTEDAIIKAEGNDNILLRQKEYYPATDTDNELGTVAPWFDVDFLAVNGIVSWRLRKNLSAGRYGIRARAIDERIDGDGNGYYIERRAEGEFVNERTYVILYGERLKYITAYDAEDNSRVYNVSERGKNTTVRIHVQSNDGAMRTDHEMGYYNEREKPENAGLEFDTGNLISPLGITWVNLNSAVFEDRIAMEEYPISIEHNGKKVNWEYTRVDGGIDLKIPNNMTAGRYVVKFSHVSNPGIMGLYVIDNGNPIPLYSTAGRVTGIIMLVLGLLAAIAGLTLFAGPKISLIVQDYRYRAIENKIYKKDKKSIKAREKEAEEVLSDESLTGKARARKFLESIADSRKRREIAREAGMTTEEYLEAEEKRKLEDEARLHSFSDIRGKVNFDAGTDTAAAGQDFKAEGEPEFEILNSVRNDAIYGSDEFVKNVIRPNLNQSEPAPDESKDDTLNEKPAPAEPAGGTSILSRLKKLADTEKPAADTKPIDDNPKPE